MIKRCTPLFMLLFVLVSCKQETNQKESTIHQEFATLLDAYYEDGLKLNPILATTTGDDRYNDVFTNPLSQEHIAKTKAHFNSYKEKVNACLLYTSPSPRDS